MLSRTNEVTGAGLTNLELTGSDLAFQTEVGYNFGKFSMYGSGNLSTTLYGSEQTATFYNFGLKRLAYKQEPLLLGRKTRKKDLKIGFLG